MSATSGSKGAITYSVNGPATVSGSSVTTTGVGTVVVTASQVANGNYTAASATTTVTVVGSAPTLTFAAISGHTFGDVFTVSASSASQGAVTYSLTSGPASISGSTVTTTGVGTVVLAATQAASGNYRAATASSSFNVAQAVPTLTFAAIAAHEVSDVFTVSASSASKAVVTYSVGSGPASIVGSTVTTNGVGTVVLNATQSASANYTAASASISFIVGTTLQFTAIPPQIAGTAFEAIARSASPGPITYSVVSGPAIILSGSSCEPIGAGTVVLKAHQAASGSFPGMDAVTSFTVTGQSPNDLTFSAVTQKLSGSVFNVNATSSSKGAITYSVVSGGATITGSTVAITGTSGTVTLKASQAASGTYPASTTTITFPITVLAPTLTLAPVPPQTSGSAFHASATSDSQGALTYSIVSGPAKVSGSTVTTLGPGTVVLRVDLSAYGVYGAGNKTESFQVN